MTAPATTTGALGRSSSTTVASDRYKWTALFNVTLGVLMSTIDGSITLIAMPDIFRGIHLDPLQSGNSFYLLWMLLGFLVVTSVLVVNFGRLGDIYGRVKLYNLGFVVYTFFSLLLTVTWMTGREGALWLVIMRVFQGVGSALLLANSAAILTDAFPEHQRGMALGINNVAGISGIFIGLVLGGILAPIDWRLVFLISVPIGLFGTVWAYLKLEERSVRRPSKIDWPGNVTFALGLVGVMIGLTYGIEPYGTSSMGWTSPRVVAALASGVGLLVAFAVIETRSENPMFRLPLFKIRAFTAGSLSTLLSGIARGGLMFMLIIWLQGIWLPEHGYSFARTPLWAGIYMLPLTVGFLIAGPISGLLSDRYGSRPFATGGMIASAIGFALFLELPVNFSYLPFAGLLFLNGLAMGAFASPNRAGVMNSLPPQHRGVGGGMNSTFQNSAQVLSIGIFFTLMILGLSTTLPAALSHGLTAQGVPAHVASTVAHLPPVTILFSAFLGYNPIQHLLGPSVLAHVSAAHAQLLTGRSFFPTLISGPFHSGLQKAFTFSIAACLLAAACSWMRGSRYVYHDASLDGALAVGADPTSAYDDDGGA
ncbi:MAG: major facilitator superfamily 1 [Acidimicrobiaceae bacterium]|jgi:MFS family permease|nr:major facilitator superfamily 1 [Acidimicrobiaceae bacterium]